MPLASRGRRISCLSLNSPSQYAISLLVQLWEVAWLVNRGSNFECESNLAAAFPKKEMDGLMAVFERTPHHLQVCPWLVPLPFSSWIGCNQSPSQLAAFARRILIGHSNSNCSAFLVGSYLWTRPENLVSEFYYVRRDPLRKTKTRDYNIQYISLMVHG